MVGGEEKINCGCRPTNPPLGVDIGERMNERRCTGGPRGLVVLVNLATWGPWLPPAVPTLLEIFMTRKNHIKSFFFDLP
jgi:hypothetical protein